LINCARKGFGHWKGELPLTKPKADRPAKAYKDRLLGGPGHKPEIFHSDQGSQFTSSDFVERLQADKFKISWSGRRRCFDNILVERLWRTVKYEEVYLWAYSDGLEAELRLARFLWRYSHIRPHSALGGKTPYKIYTETDP
jgi:putative transposase